MQDKDVLSHISQLVEEERELRERASKHDAAPEIHSRLKSVEVSLDQCWDLLRQRRGSRDAHTDPDEARVRDARTVEHYEQ